VAFRSTGVGLYREHSGKRMILVAWQARDQGNRVAHTLAVRDGWIDLRYTGEVDYEARMSALDAVATLVLDSGVRRILADYTQASFGAKDDNASRQQYLSKAISAAVLEEAEVALIGLPPEQARAAELAGAVRNMRVRNFDDAASAIAWLLSSVESPPRAPAAA